MYTNFTAIAQRVFGSGPLKHLVWAVPLLAVIAFLLLTSAPWRRIERAAREGRARLALLTLFLAGLFRLAVMATVVAVLAAALVVQEGLFSEKHGRVTSLNYEAVQTKWGVPHHQRDLSVAHFVMRRVIEEELADGSVRERPLDEWQPPKADEQRVVLDEEVIPDPPGVEPDKLSPRRLARRRTVLRRQQLDQDSIPRSEATIDLESNPRRLGGAVYAGYNDTWRLAYEVHNRSPHATQAIMSFPLPAEGHGLFNNLSVAVEGEDWLPRARYSGGRLAWRVEMPAQSKRTVVVGYASRGLEHFRYRPNDLREQCLIAVNVKGIAARRLNFPIGSMPPKDDLTALSGDTYTLRWDLSRAITNLDVGIIVPTEPQQGYHVTRVLSRAPAGLAMLALLLVLTRWLISGRLDLFAVALVLAAYYVSHALLANLNDVLSPFLLVFALSAVPMALAATWFWRAVDRRDKPSGAPPSSGPADAGSRAPTCSGVPSDSGTLLPCQSSALVWVWLVGYPLIALYEDAAGTLSYALAAAAVIYLLVLVARRKWTARAEEKAA